MLEKAIDIAKEAGGLLMKYQQGNFAVDKKNNNPNDLVTTADFGSDILIRKLLQKEFPSDSILSEENKAPVSDYSGRVWVVDPLDGTNLFSQRKEGFCVIVGLCKNGIPSLGIVYDPISHELYYAEKGKGAYLEKGNIKKRIKASGIESIPNSRAILHQSYEGNMPYDKFTDSIKVKEKTSECSAGIGIMKIACGEIEFYFDGHCMASKWDTCGGQVILEEAGGRITDLFGTALDYKQEQSRWERPFLASNGIIHKAVVNSIKTYA